MKEEDLEGCETLLEKQVKDHSRNDVVVKKYFSRGGNFITGIDTESEESAERRHKRFERFGHSPIQTPSQLNFSLKKLQERASRFGSSSSLFEGEVVRCIEKLPSIPDGSLRKEAILLYGTDKMNTKDVLNYFCLYGPSYLEWIDDSSCTAVWEDPTSAHRAFIGKGQFPVVSVESKLIQPVWRLGEPHSKAQQLLLRVATTGDVKKPGSASRSLYYQTHGNTKNSNRRIKQAKNPNIGGLDLRSKLISNGIEDDLQCGDDSDAMETATEPIVPVNDGRPIVSDQDESQSTTRFNDLRSKLSIIRSSGKSETIKSRLG